ncbi:MAG: lipopolysaccharide biosynthesis protein [Nocardioides sp.]|nr:lipopolysaccharide biosynthesis protein [Nocardioides sp.]
MARNVSPTEFGYVAAVMSTLMVLGSLFDFGMGSLLLRERSAGAGLDFVCAVLRINGRTNAALAVVAVSGLSILALVGRSGVAWAAIPLCLWAVSEKNGQVWLLYAVAEGRTRLQFQTLMIRRAGGLGVFLCLLQVVEAPWAFSLGLVVASVAGNAYVRRRIGTPRAESLPPFREVLRSGWGYYVNSVATQARNLDVLVVHLVSGATVAGIYAVPARLTSPLRMLPTAVAPVVMRHTARDAAGASKAVAKLSLVVMGFMTAVMLTLAALAELAVDVALGPAYGDAVVPLRVLCGGLIFAFATSLLVAQLQGMGHSARVAKMSAAMAPLSLGLIAGGTYLGSATGACVGLAAGFALHAFAAGISLQSVRRPIAIESKVT